MIHLPSVVTFPSLDSREAFLAMYSMQSYLEGILWEHGSLTNPDHVSCIPV